VFNLNSKTAKEVIEILKSVFSRHGIPDIFMSDNMPFASFEMKQFADDWNFKLVTSSPTFPQSNGQSERFVQTIKTMIKKCIECGQDIQLALLNYRNSPIANLNYSPAQLLMSRSLKTKLPVHENHLMPKVVDNAKALLDNRQDKYKQYFDCGTKPLSTLKIGDSVRVLNGKTWDPAVVTDLADTPRSCHNHSKWLLLQT
jgi:hypothetical protein